MSSTTRLLSCVSGSAYKAHGWAVESCQVTLLPAKASAPKMLGDWRARTEHPRERRGLVCTPIMVINQRVDLRPFYLWTHCWDPTRMVEISGFEPEMLQCHCRVIPLHYIPKHARVRGVASLGLASVLACGLGCRANHPTFPTRRGFEPRYYPSRSGSSYHVNFCIAADKQNQQTRMCCGW